MEGMSEIEDFLQARIEEDEQRASIGWSSLREARWARDDYGRNFMTPSAVLAECAAKRAVVELYEIHRENRDARRSPRARAAEDEKAAQDRRAQEARTRVAEDALRALAAVYKDHPDYRQEWRIGY